MQINPPASGASFDSAYGGENWIPRMTLHKDEIGTLWSPCGVDNEWLSLKKVLLHTPGSELLEIDDPDKVLMLENPNAAVAVSQHKEIADLYTKNGVKVVFVEPSKPVTPNLMFCADLVFMTPEGAILARPASTIRAGEERWIARRLGDIGIPVLVTLRGRATFEGADGAWIDEKTVLIGRGLRTNAAGVSAVSGILKDMGVRVLPVDLPYGSMHLMGLLRFLDSDLAIGWPGRIPVAAVEALRELNFRVLFLPNTSSQEVNDKKAFNFVTLGPRHILMPDHCPETQSFYESLGIQCEVVGIDELAKAAGGIGCLTGVLERDKVSSRE